MLVDLPWKLFKGGVTSDLLLTYLLNATFLFGFFNPSMNATLVGGWSLGIEAIFYLLFPCFMLTFRNVQIAAGISIALLVIQIGWADDEIVGWRGFDLGAACLGMVYAAFKMRISESLAKLANYFGDATYGLYLLHPVLFFGLVQIVFPRSGIASPSEWILFARLVFGCSVIGLAFWFALLSERYFEKPVRNYFKPRQIAA